MNDFEEADLKEQILQLKTDLHYWEDEYRKLHSKHDHVRLEKQLLMMRNSALQDVIARLTSNELVNANNTVMVGRAVGKSELVLPKVECFVHGPEVESTLVCAQCQNQYKPTEYRCPICEVKAVPVETPEVLMCEHGRPEGIGCPHCGGFATTPPDQAPTCIKCGFVGCSCNGEVFGDEES